MIKVFMLSNGQEILGEQVFEDDVFVQVKDCYTYITWVPKQDAMELMSQGRSAHEATRVALVPISVLAEGATTLPIRKDGILYSFVPSQDAHALYIQKRSNIVVANRYAKA